MRAVIACVLLLLSDASAQAFTFPAKFDVSGTPVILWQQVALNPDCSVAGPVRYNVIKSAAHGAISVKTAKIFPTYPSDNPRNVCNSRGRLGQELVYVSQQGYRGPDSVEVETIGPLGSETHLHISIVVR